MTISFGRIVGAILACVIIYILVQLGIGLLVTAGLLVSPIIVMIIWALYWIFVCLAVAWALGITIPFINIGR